MSTGSVYQRKDGYWVGAVQIGGRRRVVYGKTEAQARKKLAALQRQAAQVGGLPDAGRRTVGDLLTAWLAASPDLKPRTRADYALQGDRYIRPSLGAVKLSQLTPEHIQRLYGDLQGRGLRRAPAQVHAVLHRALRVAVLWRWLPENPADRVLKPTYRAARREVWDGQAIGRFLAATTTHTCGPLWRVAIASGCRLSELCGLTWADVDLQAGTIQIRQNVQRIRGEWITSSPKTQAGERLIQLPADGMTALGRQRTQQLAWRLRAGQGWLDTGLVFSNRHGGPLQPSEPQHALQRLCRQLGLPALTPHGLRHLHASVLLAEGLPLPAVSARLGHADPSITARVYSHALGHQDQQAAALLQRVMAPPDSGEEDGQVVN